MGVTIDKTSVRSPLERMELGELRAYLHREVSKACNTAITAGVQVALSDGRTGHFALEETDQINLNQAYSAVLQGAAVFPYHADGELCRLYPAADILAIGDSATAHKLYHTTYCNHLLRWIDRTETREELIGIQYGVALPDDLKVNMEEVLNAAGNL